MSPILQLQLTRRTWRWYWVLLLANALDLLFTYTAVERGIEEMNPLLRPILLTPWPLVLKLAAFGVLGYGLYLLARRPSSIRRVGSLVRSTAVMYLVVVAIHLVGLYLVHPVVIART